MVSIYDFLQVSFVQFSDEAQTEFKLNTYSDKAQALGALANVRYKGGNTKTGMLYNTYKFLIYKTIVHTLQDKAVMPSTSAK